MEGRRDISHLMPIVIVFFLLSGSFILISGPTSVTVSGEETLTRSQDGTSSWSCYGGNYRNSRQSDIPLNYRDVTERWTYELEGSLACDPVVDHDNNVYFTSTMGFLYCLDTDGNRVWRFDIGEVGEGSPALTANGDVIIGSNSGNLYSISSEGILQWDYLADRKILSSPMIDSMEDVHFTCDDGYVYCLHSNGTLKWRSEIGDTKYSSLAISGNRLTLVSTKEADLICFDQDGGLLWRITLGNESWSDPVIDSFGHIYMGSDENLLYKINENGDILWKFETESMPYGSIGLYRYEKIILTTREGTVYCVNNMGEEVWSKSRSDILTRPPLITEDGVVVFCNGATICYDVDDGSYWYWDTVTALALCPGIGVDCLYVKVSSGIVKLGPEEPSEPGEIVLEQIGTSSRVRWGPPYTDGGVELLGYKIERIDTQSNESLTFTSPPGVYFFVDDQVIPERSYTYNVRAFNRIGVGVQTSPKDITLLLIRPQTDRDHPVLFSTDPWPMYGKDPKHTSYDGSVGNWPYYRISWHYEVGNGWIRMPPAIDRRNVAYYCDSEGDLRAIGPDGFLLWRYMTTGKTIECSPALDREGNVYFSSGDGYFYSLKPDGELRFKVKGSDYTGSSISPVITDDGRVLVSCGELNMKCYDTDGNYYWTAKASHMVYDPPAVDDSGNIYFFSDDQTLHSLDPDGRLRWKVLFENTDNSGTPSISPGGDIICGGGPGILGSYDNTSRIIWERILPGDVVYPPSVSPDGVITVLLDSDYLVRIDPEDGIVYRSRKDDELQPGSMVVLGDGRVLVFDDSVQCFGGDGELLWKMLEGEEVTGGAISEDGTIYVVGGENEMWCLKPTLDSPDGLSNNNENQKTRTLLIILGSTIIPLIILIVIVVVLILKRKKNSGKKVMDSKEDPEP